MSTFDPKQRAKEKQAAREADYAQLAESPEEIERLRYENAFLKPEQCQGPIDWSSRKLRV